MFLKDLKDLKKTLTAPNQGYYYKGSCAYCQEGVRGLIEGVYKRTGEETGEMRTSIGYALKYAIFARF